MKSILTFLILILCLHTFAGIGAKPENKSGLDRLYDKSNGKVQVFIEGNTFDFDFIRQNIRFVDFVNEPKSSDIHIIMRKMVTGSGGSTYTIRFVNRAFQDIGEMVLNATCLPNDTDEQVRENIVRTLKLGLMPYMNESYRSEQIRILVSSEGETNDSESMQTSLTEDPWDSWVFKLSGSGNFSFAEQKKHTTISGSANANRITSIHRFKSTLYMRAKNQQFKQDDGTWDEYTSENGSLYASYAYSISEHWSTGGFIYNQYSSYNNLDLQSTLKGSIEYNFFPWAECRERIFTIAYHLGAEYSDYTTTTIYSKDSESYLEHRLDANIELIDTWGEFKASIGSESVLTDLTKYMVSFSSDLSLRITKGLSVTLGFDAKTIHNQLYISQSNYSDEDILLGNVTLPSTYKVSGSMGLSFQFGSIYNNVVNYRL